MCPRATSSIESATTSRLTSDVFIPDVPIVIPSEMAMVLNSIGVPPAARTPSLTFAASTRRPKLQGIVSVQVEAMPMLGVEADPVQIRPGCRARRPLGELAGLVLGVERLAVHDGRRYPGTRVIRPR